VKTKSDHLKLVGKNGGLPGWRKAIRFLFRASLVIAIILLIRHGETYFRVSEIRVDGAGDIPSADIISAGRIREGMNIFLFREEKIADNIMNQFPHIKTVGVSRELPDSVLISLVERSPIGHIMTADGFWLIDEDMICFKQNIEESGEHPLITGIPAELVIPGTLLRCPARRTALSTFFAAWPETGGLEIEKIDLTYSYNLVVHTVDGLEIWLGDGKEMAYKLNLVQQSIPYIFSESGTRLDVRSGSRLVVSRNSLNSEKEVDP
jgi:cell division protein FtsQ